jgi:hypothetical protein
MKANIKEVGRKGKTGITWLRIGSRADICEHVTDPSGSIKGEISCLVE